MASSFPPQTPALQRAASFLARLPGIGPRTAERIAYHLLRVPREEVDKLIGAIRESVEKTQTCSTCFTLTEVDPCSICSDGGRDRSVICVVRDCQDVIVLERTGAYRGLYHVLGGVLSPMNGVGPEDLTIQPLLGRLEGVKEVVIATDPTVEGEATALYLAKLLHEKGVQTTKMAMVNMLFFGRATRGRRIVTYSVSDFRQWAR